MMNLQKRVDKLIATSRGIGGYPGYFPHVDRTLAGATRLQLEFKAEAAIGRERVFEIRAASDFELLQMVGFSDDAEGMARFSWREQNWIALLSSNLGVMNANRGEYGGPRLDKPFVEDAPIYFPLYVKYYDGHFRNNPDQAALCRYNTSKSKETLIREWWDSKHAARFISLKESWLSNNAAWLMVDDDPAAELARLLGINVSQLPETLDLPALVSPLEGKPVESSEKEESAEAAQVVSANTAEEQIEASGAETAPKSLDIRRYFPPVGPYSNW